MNSKDLLLCFLYSPGQTDEYNEPIVGRTKLTKMMFLFEKQIYNKFFKDSIEIALPDFQPYYFGPFSKQLFDDLIFFESVGLIIANETNIPLSAADKVEFENAFDESVVDEWSEATFEDENEKFESSYSLSEGGVKYVIEKVWSKFSPVQKDKLKAFKSQINAISLDSLLKYVYTKYPEDAKKSIIAHKYMPEADEQC